MRNILKRASMVVSALTLALLNVAFVPQASAGVTAAPQVILTNMNINGAGSIIIRFTTVTGTGTNLTLRFPTYTSVATGQVANGVITVAQNYNSTSCTTITGASAYIPGSPTASGNNGTGLITFSSLTALASSTSYCAVLTGTAITNGTSAGSYSATITAGADTAQPGAIDVITGNDQVTVGATVPPSFTLGLSGTTDNFTSNLSTAATATTTGITATVNTNATNGWSVYASSTNVGVKSPSLNYTIPSKPVNSNTTLVNNTEGYVTGLATGSITQGSGAGVTSIPAAYQSSGLGNGAGLNTVPTKIASSTSTAIGASVVFKEFASIAGSTPAANDYSDTVTVVGAGSF